MYINIYIYFILAFIYSWYDILQDFINSINVDADVDHLTQLHVRHKTVIK